MTVTNTVDGTAGPARGLSARTLRTYAADWALFTDWCAATDTTALPADPHVVVDFLIGCPAAPGTQRCRVAAIDHHHTAAGLDRPGESVAVRAALGRPTGEPFQPKETDRDAVERALRGLPSHGWTAGMFGRRDRALLVLSQLAGVPYRHLATLKVGDITIADGVATIRSPAGGVVRRLRRGRGRVRAVRRRPVAENPEPGRHPPEHPHHRRRPEEGTGD